MFCRALSVVKIMAALSHLRNKKESRVREGIEKVDRMLANFTHTPEHSQTFLNILSNAILIETNLGGKI